MKPNAAVGRPPGTDTETSTARRWTRRVRRRVEPACILAARGPQRCEPTHEQHRDRDQQRRAPSDRVREARKCRAGDEAAERDPGLLDAQEERAMAPGHHRSRQHVGGRVDGAVADPAECDAEQEQRRRSARPRRTRSRRRRRRARAQPPVRRRSGPSNRPAGTETDTRPEEHQRRQRADLERREVKLGPQIGRERTEPERRERARAPIASSDKASPSDDGLAQPGHSRAGRV